MVAPVAPDPDADPGVGSGVVPSTVVALIGDVVGSRRTPDRAGTQRRLDAALAEVNTLVPARQPLESTVGDEFQGVYATPADAALAALLVRLVLLPGLDVRCGLGGGQVEVIDATRTPRMQDGSAWWAAREALGELDRPRRTASRTWYAGPGADAVTAHLLLRDALVDRLTDRGRRILRDALLGHTQAEIAVREQISASAVSQHVARGVGAVREAAQRWGRTGPAGEEGS